MVFTRNQVLLADSSGQASPDVADYPMIAQAIRTGRVAQGTVTTANGRVAATAVPLFPQDGSGTRGRRGPGDLVAPGRGQRGERGAAPAAVRHGPGAGHQPAPRLHGLVLHRPPAEAHRAQRRAHRRRRPLGQGARDRGGRDRAAGRHLQRHGRQAAQRLRPGRVRARPRRGAPQRPERRRDRRLRRRQGDHRQSGRVDPAGRADPGGRRRSRRLSRRTSPSCGATRRRTPTSTWWCSPTTT